jgi:hypothetical protein
MFGKARNSQYPSLRIMGFLLTIGSAFVGVFVVAVWILTMVQNDGIIEPFPPAFGTALMGLVLGQVSKVVVDMADQQSKTN